jgi:hypothetical protein
MKIAILVRPGNNCPMILALSLKKQLEDAGNIVEISDQINMLNRLVSYKTSQLSFHFWLKEKITNYIDDSKTKALLRRMDAVIISESSPIAFWKKLYNIEKLKAILKKPVLFYEVYYLGNAPTQIITLKKNNDPLEERYDGHLFVSPVTEISKGKPQNAFCIGLLAKSWDLKPLPKKELIALVDFAQPGFEDYRELQIEQLKNAGIKFISLDRRYAIEEIRKIYQRVSIFFVQFPEAFGLPILECLCTGAQIFTPDSAWPMSWSLEKTPEVHGKGILPPCFTIYEKEDDLLKKLLLFKEGFDLLKTPETVFNTFIKNYPTFYGGDSMELTRCLKFLEAAIQLPKINNYAKFS